MAYHDASASTYGSLDSTLSIYLHQDVSSGSLGKLQSFALAETPLKIHMDGTLGSVVDSEMVQHMSVRIEGTLKSKATGRMLISAGLVQASGTLSSTNGIIISIDAYCAMYGFLGSTAEGVVANALCANAIIDMKIETFESAGCKIGASMDIIRYRGDTYPFIAKLGRNGNFNVTGMTFKMSIKIGEEAISTVIGSIDDTVNGIVSFALTPESVAIAGEGVYDIQGDDGSFIYTYDAGNLTLLQDLTV